MHIIAGQFRGKRLKAPKGLATRPVLARVREALFSVLGDVEGLRFLDLFAGTGAVGIEALSRIAASVVFVELGSLQCRIIHENIPDTVEGAQVIRSDAFRALKRFAIEGETFDIVFADPPYDRGLSQRSIESVCTGNILGDSGILVVTSRNNEILPDGYGACKKIVEKRYGDTMLTFYKKLRGDNGKL